MLQIRPVALLFILKTNTTSPMMPVMTSVCLMFVVLFIIINAKMKTDKRRRRKKHNSSCSPVHSQRYASFNIILYHKTIDLSWEILPGGS